MPRDTLTRERIVTTAVELLDASGLEGLNMRALGGRLDAAATAVYWHVGSKENLVALAADQAWREIALPDTDVVDWRTAASQMATELYGMLTRHPWLLQAFGSFLSYGPGKARHDDCGLAIFESAGFRGSEADQAAASVFTFVLGNALGPAASASFNRKVIRDGANAEQVMQEAMAGVRAIAAQYPHLRARLETTSAGDYGAAPENTFEFGLHAILDGLEARLPDRGARSDAPAPVSTPTPGKSGNGA